MESEYGRVVGYDDNFIQRTRCPGEAGEIPALSRNREPSFLASRSTWRVRAAPSVEVTGRSPDQSSLSGVRCGPWSRPLLKGFFVKRIFTAACAAVVTPALLIGTAAAANASDAGLFGSVKQGAGAYSQSMAIIGITNTVESAPSSSVTWLVKQQCASGGFQLYRTAQEACTTPDAANYTGPDTNTTAVAVVALLRSGKKKAAKLAGKALLSWQNADGGFPYFSGGDSDVNSTGLVAYALAALPDSNARSTAIDNAQEYVAKAMLPCSSPVADRYALPYQPGGTADSMASAQGLLGLAPLSARAGKSAQKISKVTCNSDLTKQIASYLQRAADANGWVLPNSWVPGEDDWISTATAVIALHDAGWSPSGISSMSNAMAKHVDSIIYKKHKLDPGSIGTLMFAVTSANRNPMSFGGKNLYSLLLSTLQK